MMRNLGMALIATAALLLGRASFAPAADVAAAVVIEEPGGLADGGSGAGVIDDRIAPRLVVVGSPAAPQPTWPLVLAVASLVGMSVMAARAR